MHMLTSKMPRKDGHSWKTIKLHLLLHYIKEAKRFGAPRNWDLERPEHFHIYTTKTHGHRAHKCRETFEQLTAQRLADLFIIESMHNIVMDSNNTADAQSDSATTNTNAVHDATACGTTCQVQRVDQTNQYCATWFTKSNPSTLNSLPGVAKFACKTLQRDCVTIKTEMHYNGMVYIPLMG